MQDTQLVRNVVLLGHGKCGKTSLAEALLFTAGKTNRLGKVDDGSSIMDFEPEEVRRRVSINSSFNNYAWNKHQVFLIDTPGDDNFVNEAMFAAQIADATVFTIGAVLGVKNQTEKFASFVEEKGLPALIFINKMDRERADFEKTINEIKEQLPLKPAIVHLPIGAEASFKGVVDIVRQKAYLFDGEGSGKVTETVIPAEMTDEVASHREALMEAVAETDDELIEKFLEEGELSDADLAEGLRKAAKAGALCPVAVGAATANLGTELLLGMINDYLPSPLDRAAQLGNDPKTEEVIDRRPSADAPFSALVFKTMADPYAGRLTIFRVYSGTLQGDSFYNASKECAERFGQLLLLEGKEQRPVESAGPGMIIAVTKLKETVTGDTLCAASAPIIYDRLTPMAPSIAYAVTPAKKGDEDKLFSSINKMLEEDLTLKLTREPQTNEIILAGVGQIHIEVIGEKIKRKFGVEIALQLPKVPYRETIKGKARVQGKHKKQTGGHGQFADSWIEMEPLPRGEGFRFEDRIIGGVIPRQYIPAVEKGVLEAMAEGIVAGYPVVDIKVAVVDGSFHAVDSSEMAFKISGSMAFKKGAQEANPVLLEPIMGVAIKIPKECVGDVIGDLNGRRGRIMGMDSEPKCEVINAQVPMAEIQLYAQTLTSITGGRGQFSTTFSHYEEVPAQLADKVVAAAKAANS
ncbi:MAG: elongation factor G [Desulfobulbaceae bacterium]|nr:elongation factor G [Desulfobulbaceae bacterium]